MQVALDGCHRQESATLKMSAHRAKAPGSHGYGSIFFRAGPGSARVFKNKIGAGLVKDIVLECPELVFVTSHDKIVYHVGDKIGPYIQNVMTKVGEVEVLTGELPVRGDTLDFSIGARRSGWGKDPVGETEPHTQRRLAGAVFCLPAR